MMLERKPLISTELSFEVRLLATLRRCVLLPIFSAMSKQKMGTSAVQDITGYYCLFKKKYELLMDKVTYAYIN